MTDDRSKPKRPPGSFNLFKEELSKKAEEKWKCVSEGEKAPFRAKEKELRAEYEKKKKQWKEENPSSSSRKRKSHELDGLVAKLEYVIKKELAKLVEYREKNKAVSKEHTNIAGCFIPDLLNNVSSCSFPVSQFQEDEEDDTLNLSLQLN